MRACGVEEITQPDLPVRIAARRQRELMAIITYNDHEDAEWLDDDFVDRTGNNTADSNNTNKNEITSDLIN